MKKVFDKPELKIKQTKDMVFVVARPDDSYANGVVGVYSTFMKAVKVAKQLNLSWHKDIIICHMNK